MYYRDVDIASYRSGLGYARIEFDTGVVVDEINHPLPQELYRRVGQALLDDGRNGDVLPWAMDTTDDGKGVVFRIGGDGEKVTLHPDGITLERDEEDEPEPSAVGDVLAFLIEIRDEARECAEGARVENLIDWDVRADRAEDLRERLNYVWNGVF